MKNKFEFVELDKRVLQRRLERHELTQGDHQKVLKALPDEASHGEELKVYTPEEKIPGDTAS
ncbi:MAG: hypothetical protein HY542_06160 [Deltaproteobacteria bacterium]|nr:hypothetical protein [Deltaproteobacteria bacterium]